MLRKIGFHCPVIAPVDIRQILPVENGSECVHADGTQFVFLNKGVHQDVHRKGGIRVLGFQSGTGFQGRIQKLPGSGNLTQSGIGPLLIKLPVAQFHGIAGGRVHFYLPPLTHYVKLYHENK